MVKRKNKGKFSWGNGDVQITPAKKVTKKRTRKK